MGRTNRSRKRREENSKAKKERYVEREKERLKKMLGIVDTEDAEPMNDIEEVAIVKTARELKQEKKAKEEETLALEVAEEHEKGESITVVNEKTGKSHTYNSKTLKDQHGSYPPWHKPRKTAKRMRKLNHARKLRFKQAWTVTNIPL